MADNDPLFSPRLIGYARVSTDEQATEAQEIELRTAGCSVIVQEHGSGASRALLREISAGDTLVVAASTVSLARSAVFWRRSRN